MREEKATSLPSWLSVAERAVSEASVSTTRGMSRFGVTSTEFSNSFFKCSKEVTTSVGNGKVMFSLRGFILSENMEIYVE